MIAMVTAGPPARPPLTIQESFNVLGNIVYRDFGDYEDGDRHPSRAPASRCERDAQRPSTRPTPAN